MNRSKVFISFAALFLCIVISAAALAEGTLAALWDSGCDFLFRTDNVTVSGEAAFSLDGERFKTAQLHYIQDGSSSFYGLKLLTPRADGSERETGWTIISGGKGDLYVMEAYHPGVYRQGTDAAQNSLLRRSVQLDALTELGGLLVGQIEPLLPEGAITATEADGIRNVHIAATEDQIPDVALSALNLAAGFLSDRWFSYGHDRRIIEDECVPFQHYITVTQALTDGTVRWTLRNADVDFTLDAQGRLTAVRGKVKAASTFWDGAVREVEVQFDLAMTDYGTSSVKPFDPIDYNVVLPREQNGDHAANALDENARNAWISKAENLLLTQGFVVDSDASRSVWRDQEQGVIKINIANSGEDPHFIAYSEDGSLITFCAADTYISAHAGDMGGVDMDTVAAAEKLLLAFIREQNPALAESMGELTVQNLLTGEDGSQYLAFSVAGDGYFVVRVAPSLRIEYCTWSSNG